MLAEFVGICFFQWAVVIKNHNKFAHFIKKQYFCPRKGTSPLPPLTGVKQKDTDADNVTHTNCR